MALTPVTGSLKPTVTLAVWETAFAPGAGVLVETVGAPVSTVNVVLSGALVLPAASVAVSEKV